MLPETGYLRIKQIIGCPAQGIPAIIPIARSTWHRWVDKGIAPRGVMLSEGVRAWRVEDIRKLVADMGVDNA